MFYNIIIKSADVDKGGGGKTLIYKMWIKVFFFNPSLSSINYKIVTKQYSNKSVPMTNVPLAVQLPQVSENWLICSHLQCGLNSAEVQYEESTVSHYRQAGDEVHGQW